MYPFSATLPTLIAEVLFVFVNSAVQDFALIIFKVVSEPFHASCQQSIPPLLQNYLILLLNLEKHSQSHISLIMWCKMLSI